MKKTKLVLCLLAIVCSVFFASCSGGGSQVQSGFRAMGERWVQVAGTNSFIFVSATNISGQWLLDYGGATGSVRSFSFLCLGPCPIEGGRAPARWNIVAGTPQLECIGYLEPTQRDVTLNSTQTSRCVIPGVVFPFAPNPNAVDLQAPPATFEMSGDGLNTEYGMPYIEYRDIYTGALIGSTSATAVSAKGTWLQAAMPDLSSVYSGGYTVLVSNVRSDGSLEPVGTATVQCYGRDYVYEPPPDPGPCDCPPDTPCLPCEPIIQ